jgi:hypothetical protein
LGTRSAAIRCRDGDHRRPVRPNPLECAASLPIRTSSFRGLNFAGIPRRILNLAGSGAIRLAVSDEILDEATRVLRREKFGWPEVEIERAIAQISRFAEHVESKQRIKAIAEDPTDGRILECAVAS